MRNVFSGPGLPCPQCGALITVTLEQLAAAAAIGCSDCGLELRIDLEQSRESLNAVRDLRDQLIRANEIKS